MLERARNAGVKSMIITGTSLSESQEALDFAKEFGMLLNVVLGALFTLYHFQGFSAPLVVILLAPPSLTSLRVGPTRTCLRWTN